MKIKSTILLAAFALTASAVVATAQEQQPGRGGRGDFNPEAFRAQMEERMKTSLKVTDDEWKVLQPLIEKVTTKQRESMGSRFGGLGSLFGRGRGGGDNPPGGAPAPGGATAPGGTPGGDRGGNRGDRGGDRAGSAESQALRTALESESTSADDLKAKLTALREAHKKAAAELAAVRGDLQKVLTVRQEAVLVSMGILE